MGLPNGSAGRSFDAMIRGRDQCTEVFGEVRFLARAAAGLAGRHMRLNILN